VHEARLCLSLIDLAVERLAEGERVVRLRVEVGDLSGVVPEALAGAFPICAGGTPAEGAFLALERTPGRNLVLRDMEVI
jgi:hydrogenase nickel incorporation protein HypA/HybF